MLFCLIILHFQELPFMEEGETQAPSLWLLRVSLQTPHLFFLVIHDGLRRCDDNWFGKFCDDKKCSELEL